MNIRLCSMTKALCREYFAYFQMDPDVFISSDQFRPYIYNPDECDARVDRYAQLGRIYLAIMWDQRPVGEVVLKNFDLNECSCVLSIHLQNDTVKNIGIGTRAEILALQYAFETLNQNTVYAEAILKNTRSQHVLEKVGFHYIRQDDAFRYYRCDKKI